jgi:Fe2+ or Zn2+ uptake regulation protein
MPSVVPPHPVAKEVLCYFLRNPRAADSLEGIARWRLLSENVRRKVDETRQALDWLVENGLLTQTSIVGAETIYSLTEANHEAVAKFLDGFEKDAGSPCR